MLEGSESVVLSQRLTGVVGVFIVERGTKEWCMVSVEIGVGSKYSDENVIDVFVFVLVRPRVE